MKKLIALALLTFTLTGPSLAMDLKELNDAERAQRVAAGLRFGHCGWNTGTGPTPEAPFGGMKASGIGREGGLEGLFEFVEAQTVPRGF